MFEKEQKNIFPMWDLKNSASLLIDGVLCLCLFHNRRTISVCVISVNYKKKRNKCLQAKTTKLPVYVLVTVCDGKEIKLENTSYVI